MSIQTYHVTIVREAGSDPITGEYLQREEEALLIAAQTEKEAHRKSYFVCTIHFRGQLRRTFINGEEYFNEDY